MALKNLFCTILTNAAPSSNYRGESEENRTVIQKVTKGDSEYAVISPESMRNALREILTLRELPMNRRRLFEEDQLAVEFKDYPDASTYADDFLFGYLVADNKEMKKLKRPAKRDSVLRMNFAIALEPYRFDATFHQSPLNAGESKWKNATTSALLHREVSHTAFQYPFALNLEDCRDKKPWARALLAAIGELSNVAGGHARSYFEMAPRSLVARLTASLVGGFDSYGFDRTGHFPELARIKAGDLPGSEFVVAGALARELDAQERSRLEAEGVRFFDNAQAALLQLAKDGLGS
ncbi:MAG TPA: type I-B CRISPR-associated protein Cas7/Cst2/DevR [Kofleriaceae bacterium]|nr:type I-B CRISPR-associated protein Cas7/Cst2/DevR [Kofleriaceae bacterium]